MKAVNCSGLLKDLHVTFCCGFSYIYLEIVLGKILEAMVIPGDRLAEA